MTGISNLPGFKESIELLYNHEKYSLTDIGLMFGVSRERIRQLMVIHRIPFAKKGRFSGRGLQAKRIWNDDLNRFIPVSAPATRKLLKRSVDNRLNLLKRRQKRKDKFIAIVRALKATLGDDPTLKEINELMFPGSKYVTLQGKIVHSIYSEQEIRQHGVTLLFHSLLREAGAEPRGVGKRRL